MNKSTDLKSQIEDLETKLGLSKEFEKKWAELTAIVFKCFEKRSSTSEDKKAFNQLKRWLSRNYSKTGLVKCLSYSTHEGYEFDPISTLLLEISHLQEIVNPPFLRRLERDEIMNQWNMIINGLPLCIGRLENDIQQLKLSLKGQILIPKIPLFTELCEYIESKLRACIYDEPVKEKQIQNSVETLLKIRDYKYKREKVQIPHSSKSVRPDFVINDLKVAIEVKFVKDVKRRPDIIEEISSDITSYSKKFKRLIFVVYDMGTIRDIHEFRNGLEKENIKVLIIKH